MAGYQPKKRKLTCEINVVPYIDVMLVLLIIFMVTSPFITQGVDVELPKTSTAKPASELAGDTDASFIIVEVDRDGNLGLSVNNEDVQRGLSLQDIIVRVRAELSINPDSPVAVGGDAATPYAEVVLLLDELSRAGIPKVGLLTDIRNSRRSRMKSNKNNRNSYGKPIAISLFAHALLIVALLWGTDFNMTKSELLAWCKPL